LCLFYLLVVHALISKSSDASDFLRKHPWPGRSIADTFDDSSHRKGLPTKRFLSALKIICGRTGDEDIDDEDPEEERALFDVTEDNESGRPFYWSRALQQSFREELEKYVGRLTFRHRFSCCILL
jgi:hypothetical protein